MDLFISFIVFGLIIILILLIGIAVERLVNCLFDCLRNKCYMLNKVEINLIASINPSLNSYKFGYTYGST